MIPAGFHPDRDLPVDVSQADLLDWIEADAGQIATAAPGSSIARVVDARNRDARLASLLDAMRVDRAALGSLETPAPPRSVAEAVLEEHERQALLDLSDLASHGPRAGAGMVDDEAFSFSAMPRWFKPAMAVAAGLALVFGAWQLYPFLAANPAPQPGSTLALEEPDDEAPAPDVAPIVDPPSYAAAVPSIPAVSPREHTPSASEILKARFDMPFEQAFELAREGRLMIVIGARDAQASLDAAARITARPIDASWRLRDARPELVAALSTPDHARLAGQESAGDTLLSAARGPLGQIEVVMAATPLVTVAETATSPEAVLELLESLGHMGEQIRFEELEQPLPGTGEIAAPVADETLLWWDHDPATWRPWAAIPVRFVESR
ncbi:hypothetical protein AY599_23475 [Leptolyngbya valderiana BDU 20041]|nr:hypothetical protein AY599_23475 [Leptolyngbya valderiana BDU 20041]